MKAIYIDPYLEFVIEILKIKRIVFFYNFSGSLYNIPDNEWQVTYRESLILILSQEIYRIAEPSSYRPMRLEQRKLFSGNKS